MAPSPPDSPVPLFPLAGSIPLQWPVIFSRLQYLSLQFNDLFSLAGTSPSGLPKDWSSAGRRVFQSLSMLTLYPGNDYLCSIPDVEGGFLDVNRGAWGSRLAALPGWGCRRRCRM